MTSRFVVSEERVERARHGGVTGVDGDNFETDAEILGKGAGVCEAVFGGVRAGHADADHVFFADGFDGDGGDESGINAAAETDQHAAKAALANIIACAENEGLKGGIVIDDVVAVIIALIGAGVEENEIFFERFGAGDDFAVRGHGEACAIEDELIVSADHVDVDEREAEALGGGAEDVFAFVTLADIPRRGVDGNDDLRAFVHEFFDWVALIAAVLPELLIVPAVFADGEGDFGAGQFEDFLRCARKEIAGFVEDVVVREQHFDLLKYDAAVLEDGGGVLGADGGVFGRAGDVA